MVRRSLPSAKSRGMPSQSLSRSCFGEAVPQFRCGAPSPTAQSDVTWMSLWSAWVSWPGVAPTQPPDHLSKNRTSVAFRSMQTARVRKKYIQIDLFCKSQERVWFGFNFFFLFFFFLTILGNTYFLPPQEVMGQCFGIFVIGISRNKKSTLGQNNPLTSRQYVK